MRNLKIFLTCLLEEFEAFVFFALGVWFAWILLLHNEIVWYFVAGVILLTVLFPIITELIWYRRKR